MRRPEFISRLGSTVVALPATVRWTMRGYRREVRCIARKADSLASGRQLTSTLFGWMTLGIGSSSVLLVLACSGMSDLAYVAGFRAGEPRVNASR
jgi:hypothetical protein